MSSLLHNDDRGGPGEGFSFPLPCFSSSPHTFKYLVDRVEVQVDLSLAVPPSTPYRTLALARAGRGLLYSLFNPSWL